MNTKTIFLSAALCGSLPALAQSSDEHVYKTDVITASDAKYQLVKPRDYEIKKDGADYTLNAGTSDGVLSFDFAYDTPLGLVINNSRGLLQKVQLNWKSNCTDKSQFAVYVRDEHFVNTTDLYADNLVGLSIISFDKQTLVSEFEIEGAARYVGLKPTFYSYLSSITLTWQLAHFRDNQTIDRLGTLCLPYNVSAEDLQGQIIPFTVAGKITGSDGKVSQIILEEAQNIEAGVPYIYIAKTQNVCLKYSQESSYTTSPQNFKGLYGTLTSTTVGCLSAQPDDVFVISNNAFTLAGTDVSIPANRAYICMSKVPECGSPSTARQLIIGPDGYELIGGSPTEALSSPRQQANKVIDYDINGRIISTTSAPRVILRKGRKVINPSAQIFR